MLALICCIIIIRKWSGSVRFTVDNTVAIAIDFQDRILPAMSNKEELKENVIKLLKGFKVLNVPVIFSQQYTKGLGMTDTDIIEAYTSVEDFSYYDKVSFSCYDDEQIREALNRTGCDNIIVFGIEAHVCMLQTVIDLLDSDRYNVIVVTDCSDSRKVTDKEIAYRRLEQEGAFLSTYESMLFELTGAAGTDTFKAISKIVK